MKYLNLISCTVNVMLQLDEFSYLVLFIQRDEHDYLKLDKYTYTHKIDPQPHTGVTWRIWSVSCNLAVHGHTHTHTYRYDNILAMLKPSLTRACAQSNTYDSHQIAIYWWENDKSRSFQLLSLAAIIYAFRYSLTFQKYFLKTFQRTSVHKVDAEKCLSVKVE